MLDGIPLANLTPSVLLGITVLMLLLGWLVPKRTLTKAEKEAERWRLAYEAEREARVLSDGQTTELLELAKTSRNIIAALFEAFQAARQSSGGTYEMVPKGK